MTKRKVMIRFAATKKFDDVDYYLKTVIRRAVVATLEYEKFPYDAEVLYLHVDSNGRKCAARKV